MFKLLRYYSIASFVAILAAAVLLTWFYRQVAIQGIVRLAERGNLDLAKVAMTPIRPELLQFLAATADLHPDDAVPPPPPQLADAITRLVHEDHSVARIKIYNLHGLVVFSTERTQIGDDQSTNAGVLAATRGQVSSELVYRDTFNTFDEVTEEDNLVQTYLPIRAETGDAIQGVFELYGDIDDLMHQNERMQLMVIGTAVPVLLALYVVLVLVVRRANRTVAQQQQTIHERNETLALMAAHMLRSEESQKKQVAFELQEGVAQTLAAVKFKAETGGLGPRDAPAGEPADSVIPMLQDAIQEVRSIATGLRPSSLDDLGLLATVGTARREFEARHPGFQVRQQSELREGDIPSALKDILHRIVVSVFEAAASHARQGSIAIAIDLEHEELVLRIDVAFADGPGAPLRAHFGRMEQLTTLSGGRFDAAERPDRSIALRAAWTR